MSDSHIPTPIDACCATCRFYYVGTTAAFPSAPGMCRRHAPIGPALLASGGWQVFPPMTAGHWCGEHETDPEMKNALEAALAQRDAA